MSTIEDRLRAATRAAAQTVAPGSAPPPPPLPARRRLVPAAHPRWGSGWPGWMAPLVAAAAVAAAIATSVVVSGALSLGHARSPSQSARPTGTVPLHPALAAPPGIPAYDVALAPGPDAGQSTRAVVRATATGAVLATVRPPRPYATFTWVTVAADDRTFVLAAQPAGQPTASGRVVMKFFALRLDPAAGTAKLTALPTPTVSGTWIQAEGLALSPDGKRLAVAVSGTQIRVRQFSAIDGRPLGILATLHYRRGAITGWPDVLWSNPSGSQLIISTTKLGAAPSKNGDLTPREIGTVTAGHFAPLPGIPGGQRPVW